MNKKSDFAFAFFCLLCGLPMVLAIYPPMVDIPQHAAQIASLKSMIFDGDWAFSNMFEIKPFTPYWLGYGIIMGLSVPFGIVVSVKIVVALALVAFVWSAAVFSKKMGVPSNLLWPLLVIPYGFAYQWGFLNFIVAAPLGFLLLILILNLKSHHDLKSFLLISIALHILFFAHVLIAGFFCILAIALLMTPWLGWRIWMQRCLPIFSILPVTVLWLYISLKNSPAAGDAIIWNININRIVDFPLRLIPAPDVPGARLIGIFFMMLPLFFGAKLKKNILSYIPFFVYLIWMIFFPHYIGGTFFTYQRFDIFGLPLYFLCFDYKSNEKISSNFDWKSIGIMLVAISIIGWHSLRAIIFDSEMKGYREVVKKTIPEKRILMMAFDRTSKAYNAPLMLHVAGWYQAEYGGLAEFNFAKFWISPMQYKNNDLSRINSGFEWNPGSIDWLNMNAKSFDYVLIRSSMDASLWLSEKSSGTMKLIEKNEKWQLYGK